MEVTLQDIEIFGTCMVFACGCLFLACVIGFWQLWRDGNDDP